MIKFRFNRKNYTWRPRILINNLKRVGKKALKIGITMSIVALIVGIIGIVGTSDYLTMTKSDMTVWEAIKNGGY